MNHVISTTTIRHQESSTFPGSKSLTNIYVRSVHNQWTRKKFSSYSNTRNCKLELIKNSVSPHESIWRSTITKTPSSDQSSAKLNIENEEGKTKALNPNAQPSSAQLSLAIQEKLQLQHHQNLMFRNLNFQKCKQALPPIPYSSPASPTFEFSDHHFKLPHPDFGTIVRLFPTLVNGITKLSTQHMNIKSSRIRTKANNLPTHIIWLSNFEAKQNSLISYKNDNDEI